MKINPLNRRRQVSTGRRTVSAHPLAVLTAAGLLAPSGLAMAPALAPMPFLVPSASAAPCPQVQVVFARGRFEPAGAGQIGNAFLSALRSRVPNKNIGLYAVNYDADANVQQGANDMSQHLQYMAQNCPGTRLVPGGYSLGAAVTDVVLAVPFSAMGFENPLPPDTNEHVAAVALFGNGTQWVGPITNFSPAYSDRIIELCQGADPVCNPADPHTWEANWPEHSAGSYLQSGMVNQAADFVASKL